MHKEEALRGHSISLPTGLSPLAGLHYQAILRGYLTSTTAENGPTSQ